MEIAEHMLLNCGSGFSRYGLAWHISPRQPLPSLFLSGLMVPPDKHHEIQETGPPSATDPICMTCAGTSSELQMGGRVW